MQTILSPTPRKRVSPLRRVIQQAFDAEMIICSWDGAGNLLFEFQPPSPSDQTFAQRHGIQLGRGKHSRVIYRNFEEFN